MTPEITIIIPTYNRKPYLGLAIKSALAQAKQDLEIIVVDDGSTDGSRRLVEDFRGVDSRVRLISHDTNKGPAAARNSGILGADSRYLSFLDSDDLVAPERSEIICTRLDAESEPAVLYSDSVRVHDAQTEVSSRMSAAMNRPEGMIFPQLLAGTFRFDPMLIALPKSCFKQVGLFDETLKWAEDTDMALRLSKSYRFIFERLSTYGWRTHSASSEKITAKKARLKYEGDVLAKHLLGNKNSLDQRTKRLAFDRLFGCYVGSGQWGKIFKTSIGDRQALSSALTMIRRRN